MGAVHAHAVAKCEYCGTELHPLPAEEIPEAPLLAEPIPQAKPPTQAAPQPQPRSNLVIDPSVAELGATLLGVPRFIRGCTSFLFVGGFIILFVGFVAFSQCSSRTKRNHRYVTRTQEQLNDAAKRIEREAIRIDRLPDDIEGTDRVKHVRDGWHNELEYEKVSQTRFVVRSAGPDERMKTSDDIEKSVNLDLKAWQ